MSHAHELVTLELALPDGRDQKPAPPRRKFVLLVFAYCACKDCGLAWPGMGALREWTGIGEKTLQGETRQLIESGLLEVVGFPRGGRGRATVYRVLPRHVPVQGQPCEACKAKLKSAHVSALGQLELAPGMAAATPAKPAPPGAEYPANADETNRRPRVRGIGESGAVSDRKVAPPGADDPSKIHDPSTRARAREAERPPAAPVEAPPLTPATVGAVLRAAVPGLATLPLLDTFPATTTSAATPAHRTAPQPPRQLAPQRRLAATGVACQPERPPPDPG